MSWINTYFPPMGATAPSVDAANKLFSDYQSVHNTLLHNATSVNEDKRHYYLAQLTACTTHLEALAKLLPRYRNDASAAGPIQKRLSDLHKLLSPVMGSDAEESWFNSSMPPLPTAVAEKSPTPAEGVSASPPLTPSREPTPTHHPTPVGPDASIVADLIRPLYNQWPAHVTLEQLHEAGRALGYTRETTTAAIVKLSHEAPPKHGSFPSTPSVDTNPWTLTPDKLLRGATRTNVPHHERFHNNSSFWLWSRIFLPRVQIIPGAREHLEQGVALDGYNEELDAHLANVLLPWLDHDVLQQITDDGTPALGSAYFHALRDLYGTVSDSEMRSLLRKITNINMGTKSGRQYLNEFTMAVREFEMTSKTKLEDACLAQMLRGGVTDQGWLHLHRKSSYAEVRQAVTELEASNYGSTPSSRSVSSATTPSEATTRSHTSSTGAVRGRGRGGSGYRGSYRGGQRGGHVGRPVTTGESISTAHALAPILASTPPETLTAPEEESIVSTIPPHPY